MHQILCFDLTLCCSNKMFPDDCSYPIIPLQPIGEIKTSVNVGLMHSIHCDAMVIAIN